MAWQVDFLPAAEKELLKLDPQVALRITLTLRTRIAALEDPRELAVAMRRQMGLWRWRIADYRVIGRIEGDRLRILVIKVGHRREVYE